MLPRNSMSSGVYLEHTEAVSMKLDGEMRHGGRESKTFHAIDELAARTAGNRNPGHVSSGGDIDHVLVYRGMGKRVASVGPRKL
jgi:hypothetical protein